MSLTLRVLVVWTLLLTPLVAQADDARTRARAAFVQGQTLYRQGKFGAALIAFQEAARHIKHPSVTINMAQCHRNMRRHKKALFFYKLYLTQW